MIIRYCDRCHDEIPTDPDVSSRVTVNEYARDHHYYELDAKCRIEFDKFMNANA
jgi:hypothetical protein